MDNNSSSNWRTGLPLDSRPKIVKRIMDTIQRHVPPMGQKDIGELLKSVWRFEETIFDAATDQQDYLRKVSLIMLSLETKAQATPANAMLGRLGGVEGVVKLLDPGAALPMQNGAQNLSNAVQLPGQDPGQTEERQQLLAQCFYNHLIPDAMQSSSGLGSSLSGSTGIPPTPLSASTSQNMSFNAERIHALHHQHHQHHQQQQLQQQPQQLHQQPSVQQLQMQLHELQLKYQQSLLLLQQQRQVPPLQQQQQQQPTNQLMSQTGKVPLTSQQQQRQQQQQQLMQTQLLQLQKLQELNLFQLQKQRQKQQSQDSERELSLDLLNKLNMGF